MKALYVVSLDEAAGKTTLCAGIGKYLAGKGRQVTYFKPFVAGTAPAADGDSEFMQLILGVDAPEPVALEPQAFGRSEALDKVKGALAGIEQSAPAGILLLEGWGSLQENEALTSLTVEVARHAGASVILLLRYRLKLDWAGAAAMAARFGERLLGVVVNMAPARKLEQVQAEAAAGLPGTRLLGVLPEERWLLSVSVAELAEQLSAQVLCCREGLPELAENIMLGSMLVGSGKEYFDRKENKVVISRAERPDMQLAALATSTRALVLSGKARPSPQVLYIAEEKGVPVLATPHGTLAAVGKVEEAMERARFRHENKLERLQASLARRLALAELAAFAGD